jgi:hypothetical protein
MRNAKTSTGVLLMFSCNGIDVIRKLHLCLSRRTQGDALIFLIQNIAGHYSHFFNFIFTFFNNNQHQNIQKLQYETFLFFYTNFFFLYYIITF